MIRIQNFKYIINYRSPQLFRLAHKQENHILFQFFCYFDRSNFEYVIGVDFDSFCAFRKTKSKSKLQMLFAKELILSEGAILGIEKYNKQAVRKCL